MFDNFGVQVEYKQMIKGYIFVAVGTYALANLWVGLKAAERASHQVGCDDHFAS